MPVQFLCCICKKVFEHGELYIDLGLRLIKAQTSSLEPNAEQEFHDDYCFTCVKEGKAVADLISCISTVHKNKLMESHLNSILNQENK